MLDHDNGDSTLFEMSIVNNLCTNEQQSIITRYLIVNTEARHDLIFGSQESALMSTPGRYRTPAGLLG